MKVSINKRRSLQVAGMVSVVMGLIVSSAHSYPDLAVSGPTESFPSSFKAFTPPVDLDADVSAHAPEIYEYTRDNNAGDTVILTGGGFTDDGRINYVNDVNVEALLFKNFADTITHRDFSWNGNTAIEITTGAFETPAENDRLFLVSGGGGSASIYYSDGRWMASDGAGGDIDLGAYDANTHVFLYDSANQSVSLDGRSFALKGAVTSSGNLYIGCNSPGYEDYPMQISGYRIWQGGNLVVDAVPQVDGTFKNMVDGSIFYNNTEIAGLPRPFQIVAERNVTSPEGGGFSTRFMAYGANEPEVCEIVRLDGNEVAVKLPNSLPSDAMYLLWPENVHGYGAPVAVNQTEVWWIGPDDIEGGKSFSVFGRNFGSSCWVYIEELQRWIPSDSSNPYKADFTMPSVADGTYTLWTHNGKGGRYGWGRSLEVSVRAPHEWNGKVVDVTAYGATGNGTTDDWPAVSRAVDATSPGDTLYFPAGTYALSYRFSSLSGLKIMGAGMDSTTIKPHTSSSAEGMLFDGYYTDMFISEMTFVNISESSNHLFRYSGKRNIFESVRLSSINWGPEGMRPEPFKFINNEYITFRNCKFINSSNPGLLSIGDCRQVFIDNCEFLGANHCSQLIGAWGGEEISIENSSARPYDDTEVGFFDGRWFVTADYWGAVNRIYFGGNTSTDCAPPHVDGYHANTGEQILIEGGKYRTRGPVLGASKNTVRVGNTANIDGIKHVVTVVKGKGYGQTRKIASIDSSSDTIVLDEPWLVIPDSGSTVVVAATTHRFVVYDNLLDGKAEWVDASSDHSASTGVESYGGSVDLIVDGNTMTDLRAGIVHWALGGQAVDNVRSLQACFFNTFKNNSIRGCWEGISTIVSSDDGELDGGILAATFRENVLDGITTKGAIFDADTLEPTIRMSVFERNTFNNCLEHAVQDDVHVQNQLFLDNTGANGGVGTAMSISYDHLTALKGNSWTGYAVDYQRGPSTQLPPDQLLELPIGLVHVDASLVDGQIQSVPVWNLALSPLEWSATSSSEWLKLSTDSGVVGGQSGDGELSFFVDPELLPEDGAATETISVESGDQIRQVTVVYGGTGTLPPPPEPPPAPVLSSIEVSGPANVSEGSTAQYVCTASYSDGTTETVSANWSENSSSASINSSGVLTAGDVSSDQSLTVTASFGGKTDVHAVTIKYVDPVLTGITISGPAQITEETTGQYTCTASYSDGSSAAVVPSWSENSSFASINSSGVLAAGDVSSDQSVTVTASFGGQSDAYSVTIKYIEPLLVNLVVSGPMSLNEETTAQYTCTAIYSDGTSAAVVPSWSENSAFAAINGSGVLSTENISADENVIITATYGGKSDTHSATIKYVEPVLTGIAISGPSGVVEESSAQYFCTATYSDGTSAAVAPLWSQNSGHASINTSGLLVAGDISSDQYLTITARFGGMTDAYSVSLTYVPPALTGIVISGPTSLDENSSGQFACTAHYADGTSTSVVPSWSVNSSRMEISASGWLTVGNVGSDENATVSASFDGQLASKSLSVVAIGTEITFPLSGFAGKTIRAELWDDLSQQSRFYDPAVAPDELVLTDVEPDRWYWLVIEEYDDSNNEWVQAHANWINM